MRLQRRNSLRDFTESMFTHAADATDTADAAVDATEKVAVMAATETADVVTTTMKADAAVATKVAAAVINRI